MSDVQKAGDQRAGQQPSAEATGIEGKLRRLRRMVEGARDGFTKGEPYVVAYSDIIEELVDIENSMKSPAERCFNCDDDLKLEPRMQVNLCADCYHELKSVTAPSEEAGAVPAQPPVRCETTRTLRFINPLCKCPTYAGNLGPCIDFTEGANGRCVYCDHEKLCHDQLDQQKTKEIKVDGPPVSALREPDWDEIRDEALDSSSIKVEDVEEMLRIFKRHVAAARS